MNHTTIGPELALVHELAACGAQREAARGRIESLLEAVAWDRFGDELARHGLLTLIGSRALEAGGARVPTGFVERVVEARTRARARGLGLELILHDAVAALAEAGIGALPLKGTSLAVMAHGDVGLRESSDVDLLVAADQLQPAVAHLLTHGYGLVPGTTAAASRRPDLHLSVVHPSQTPVELHWRVHWYETQFAADMLARATPGENGLLYADPADTAASLLLFYARDGFFGLRMAADIAGWYDRNAGALPPRALEGHLRRYPRLAPALTAAARVAEDHTGVPSVAWLGDVPDPTGRIALAVRMSNWSVRGDVDQARAEISLIGGLLGPAGSLPAFVRRELLDKRDGAAPTVVHAIKMCLRYLLAFGRSVRSRDAARW